MPKLHLTDLVVHRLKPTARQLTYWDTQTRGFGIRVGRTSKTWTIVRDEQRRRITIGRYPDWSLSRARAEARRLLSERPKILPHERIRFEAALDLFLTLHCDQKNKPRSKQETERSLRKYFMPKLQTKFLDEVTTQDVATVVDKIVPRRPSAANHAFTAMRTFLRWTVRRRYIPHSPCEGMEMPAKTYARTRVLTDVELLSVWCAAERYGYPFGTIVQLLILTGQRRSEIAALQRSFFDTKELTITLPGSLTKSGRQHTFPYGPIVADILESIPVFNGLLFPARGTSDRAFNGWAKSKENLEWRPPIRHWTLHDLRRTFATNLAALKVRPHVIERLLNHSFGSIMNRTDGLVSAVAAVYNRHLYLPEMRESVAVYERHLTTLISGSTSGKVSRPAGVQALQLQAAE